MRESQHLSLIKENILLAHLTSKMSFLLRRLVRKSPLPIQNLPAARAEISRIPSVSHSVQSVNQPVSRVFIHSVSKSVVYEGGWLTERHSRVDGW